MSASSDKIPPAGMCSTMCNWDTEEWFVTNSLQDVIWLLILAWSYCWRRCDMGVDSNGCWMGNWCQDMTLGDSLDLNLPHLFWTYVCLIWPKIPCMKPLNSRRLPWCHYGEQARSYGEEEGYGTPRWLWLWLWLWIQLWLRLCLWLRVWIRLWLRLWLEAKPKHQIFVRHFKKRSYDLTILIYCVISSINQSRQVHQKQLS